MRSRAEIATLYEGNRGMHRPVVGKMVFPAQIDAMNANGANVPGVAIMLQEAVDQGVLVGNGDRAVAMHGLCMRVTAQRL